MNKFVLAALCTAALCACSAKVTTTPGEPEIPDRKQPVALSLSIQTKVQDNQWEEGDRVGLFMSYTDKLENTSNYADNQAYEFKSKSWVADQDIYWKDNTSPANFYCYYPYQSLKEAHSAPFKPAADQRKLVDLNCADLLWACTKGVKAGDVVRLSMSHLMSKVVIQLQPGKGFTKEEFAQAAKEVKLNGLNTEALVNLDLGTIQQNGTPATIYPYYANDQWTAMVVPQSIKSLKDFIQVKVGGVNYSSEGTFTFEPKTQHTLTVKVDKSSTGLEISIEKWIIDDENHIVVVK